MSQRPGLSTANWRDLQLASGSARQLPPEHWPHRQHSKIVRASASWHIQHAGNGPAILLIHGTGSSTHTWAGVFEILARNYEVLAVDLPGHGYSSALPSGRMTLDGISMALAGLLKEVGFRPDIVVGHSAGAAVALRLVLQHLPAKTAVVGINAALRPFGGSLSGLFAPLAKSMTLVPFLPKIVAHRARNFDVVSRMLKSTGSELPKQSVERYQELLVREEHVAATLQMMADWDLRTMLDDIEPVAAKLHLMVADGDEAVPPDQTLAVGRRYPEVTVREVSRAGHLVNEERPELVAEFIAAALRKEMPNGS